MIKKLYNSVLLLPFRVLQKLSSLIVKYKLGSIGVLLGEKIVFAGAPIVSLVDGSWIRIGNRVVLCSKSSRTALGVNHPVILRTLTASAKIIIEDDVGVSGASICAAKGVLIGKNSMLGANTIIADTDFHPIIPNNRRYNTNFANVDSSEVVIEENVFIGTNSIILKGVRIGRNSVVGAGSVVVADIPPNAIAAGNPCRVIRQL